MLMERKCCSISTAASASAGGRRVGRGGRCAPGGARTLVLGPAFAWGAVLVFSLREKFYEQLLRCVNSMGLGASGGWESTANKLGDTSQDKLFTAL